MPTVEIDKEGGNIVFTTDGKVLRKSIVREDTVVSVPLDGYKKVLNIYYNPETGGIVYLIEG